MTRSPSLRFLTLLAAWAAGFVLLFLITGFNSGGTPFPPTARIPVWIYIGLLVAALPAGVGVAGSVLNETRTRPITLLSVMGTSLVAAVPVLVLALWVAPSTLASSRPDLSAVEATAMTQPTLAAELKASLESAEASGEPAEWLAANRLVWEHDRRIAQVMLFPMLTLLGILIGFWANQIRWPGLRQAFLWGLGLFILISEYFSLENGFELVAMRTVDVATPAGLFPLIVPGTLIIGLGCAAAIRLLSGDDLLAAGTVSDPP